MTEEKRIYVIVAETVQTNLRGVLSVDKPRRCVLVSTPDTKTVVQPKGRIAAQVAHVVSKMRLRNAEKLGYEPYTTIILSAPDSYNLQFRTFLLALKKIDAYRFYDTNDEYGTNPVLTAICTKPIRRAEAGYALDYLQLWS